MCANNHIGPRLNTPLCNPNLIVLRICFALHTPVRIDCKKITLLLRLPNQLQQSGVIVAGKNSRRTVFHLPVHARNHAGNRKKSVCPAVHLDHLNLLSPLHRLPGSTVENPGVIQRLKGVAQSIFSVIQRMIVRESHDINPHLT